MLSKFTYGVFVVVAGGLGYLLYDYRQENQKLQFVNILSNAEINLLRGEVLASENKPSYNEGYRDALIRQGRPNQSGSYQDGYDAAIRIVGNGDYATGYHSAIKQFGYQPDKSLALVADPKPDSMCTDCKCKTK